MFLPDLQVGSNLMSGIVALSDEQIEVVDGGLIGCLIVVAAVGIVALAVWMGYEAEHNSDNQNKS